MTNIIMPVSFRATRARLVRIALLLGLLALCFSAAATRVEHCRTIAGELDNGSSGGLSVGPRTVCTTEIMAAYVMGEAWAYLKRK